MDVEGSVTGKEPEMSRIEKGTPMLRLSCLLGTAVLIGAGCAGVRPQREDAQPESRSQAVREIQRAAEDFMKRHAVQGLSIAVADSSGLIWSGGQGLADRSAGRAFTPDTMSFPGSVSKLFTATAVMMLAERGQVDLDAPLVRYLPDLAIRTDGWPLENVTVRSLLTHHSGLPSDRFKGMVTDLPPAAEAETPAALAALLGSDYAPRLPDTAFAYSNLGFSLLGALVERVSGKLFDQFVREHIFIPCGMRDSTFSYGEPDRGAAARGYRGGREQRVPYLRDTGAGGMLTTANDMGRFLSQMLALRRGKPGLLSSQTLTAMWTRQNGAVAEDLGFRIGLGWWLGPFDSLPGEELVVHGGDWLPFLSLVMILPQRDLAVFIMANSLDGSGSMTLEDLAMAAARSFAKSERGAELSAAPPLTTSRRIPAGVGAAVTGDWSSMAGMLRIREEGGGLRVNFAGKWFDCVWRSDGRLGFEARILGFTLPVAELAEYSLSAETVNGEPALGFRCHGILLSVCRRVHSAPVDAAWKGRVGPWKIPAGEATDLVQGVELTLDNQGRLLLCYRFFGSPVPRVYPLETLSETRARLMGSGRGLGESLVVEGDGIDERLVWSGFHMVRQRE
jgi:CubicO group peptidase (beta-lactamase class C family)